MHDSVADDDVAEVAILAAITVSASTYTTKLLGKKLLLVLTRNIRQFVGVIREVEARESDAEGFVVKYSFRPPPRAGLSHFGAQGKHSRGPSLILYCLHFSKYL